MNKVIIAGEIVQQPELSHELFGEKMYEFKVSTKRTSGTPDIISCLVAENLVREIRENKFVNVHGEIRTCFKPGETGGRRLIVNVFVKSIGEYENDVDEVYAYSASLGRSPKFREVTGGKKLSELMLGIERGRKDVVDVVPAICWNGNAEKVLHLKPGDKVSLTGRLQSREYTKPLENGETLTRTVYEISVYKIKKVKKEKK